jgi:hypothetical protein
MKRCYMKRNLLAALFVTLTLVLGLAVTAPADTGARNSFNSKYPGNLLGGTCTVCHTSPPATNPYGTALKNNGGSASNIPDAAFTTVEPLDSDGDGVSNIDEINAGTYPGDRNSFPSVPAVIDLVVPTVGTLGTQFTITGSGLGDKKGKIVLSNDLGSATLKIANGGWTSTLISATLGKALPPGFYDVTVYLQPYKTTSPILLPGAFAVEIPAIGSLSASSGPAGTEITITGTDFGTKKGKVYIDGMKKGSPKNQSCKVILWDMNPTTGVSTVTFLVPNTLDPGTYPLTVTNTVGSSASTPFQITLP